MTDHPSFGDRAFVRTRSVLLTLTTWIALLAGALMLGLALMSVVSILGRWFAGPFGGPEGVPWLGAIRGDYEIMEMGAAIAIFGFLPYCQMRYTHVTIDLFIYRAGVRTHAFLSLLAAVLFALVLGLLCWRTFVGMQEMITYSEVTMMRRLPLWWAYAAGTVVLGLTTLVALFTAWDSWRGLMQGFDPAARESSAEFDT
ncbi:TRAP transporter small permease [Lutimaribacter sp. EGI FJ00015]|uniref:TRAP transporter small permease n=1 Tax=Lutimaribacter degradans TaxID=2945989 RepID=A0ACC5ZVS3_9RHOB|nr:TRAP transporter small permease [Lutimaribacter sp. EGI FJ00013]MCM2562288.1 TRAP transporter small permease [Lutimaribacter sp. EGI FJ00013]MCO0613443.1 TRAP transporter small permease [Lutimaribacter sp. EGI FJ00015]MCO0636417.1 TRAP transporter small permease [Lutimaribacter sp. EGI FJ00014]